MTEKTDKKKKRRTWASVIRLWSGAILTTLWCAGAAWYVFEYVGWQCFVKLEPNEIGDFCAGFAAPLAFFWLVLGYFQQGEELQLQSRELSSQRAAIEANELHARRDTFMRFAEEVMLEQRELAASFMNILRKNEGDVHAAWLRSGQGGRNAFYSEVIEHGFRWSLDEATAKLNSESFYHGRAIRFIDNCERIFSECDKCDEKKLIRSYFENSAMGSVYAGLCIILKHPNKFQARKKPEKLADVF